MARLYIIGPVTGMPKENYQAFKDAQDALDEAGHSAYTPHDFVPSGTVWPYAMLRSIHELTDIRIGSGQPFYDGAALLQGWEHSKGAQLEKQVAEACGIPCRTVDEWMGEA